MVLKEKVEERMQSLRSLIEEKQARIEESQKVIIERVTNLRAEWKAEASRIIDHAFCVVMETMEKAMNRLAAVAPGANCVELTSEDQPMVSKNDWVE